jgi:hypothetical protein
MTTTIIVICCAAAIVLFVLALKDEVLAKQCADQAKGQPLLGLAALGYPIMAAKKRGRAWLLVGFAAAVKVISFLVGAP